MFKPPHLPRSALRKAQLKEETRSSEPQTFGPHEEPLARRVPTIPPQPLTLSASVIPLKLGYVALGCNPEPYSLRTDVGSDFAE